MGTQSVYGAGTIKRRATRAEMAEREMLRAFLEGVA